jgi:molecular chaperone GrpE
VARLLPVLDNFERALAVAPGTETEAAFRQGVQLIYKHLRDELRREGLQPIEVEGRPFDPALHDAVATVAGGREGVLRVVAELQRGYLFRSRLLRPAQVKVVLGRSNAEGDD